MIEVTTQAELKKAIESGAQEIVIIDESLGKKVVRFMKIKKLSPWGLAIAFAALVASVSLATVTAPATGGASYLAVAPATAAASGLSISAVLAIGALLILGTAALYGLYKGYDCEVDFPGVGKVTLHKKDNKDNS